MANSLSEYVKDVWKSVFRSSADKKKDKEAYDKAKEELKEFIEGYDKGVPEKLVFDEPPEYERLEYAEKSDEEIRNEAVESLKDYYDASKAKLEVDDASAQKQKEQQKADAENSAAQKQAEIEKTFKEAKENSNKDSVKRGIARSSINEKKQDALNELEGDAVSSNAAELNKRISDIDSEISDLSLKREKALNDFNIAYATKLTTQINTLKKEQETKKKDVIKYNNSLSEKEFNEKITREIKAEEEYKKALENYNAIKGELNAKYYEDVYERIDEMLSKLTPLEARKMIMEDSFIKNQLDYKTYGRLYSKYM